MRRPVLLAALFLAVGLGACRPKGSLKLEGHWRGQRADGVPDYAQAAANAFAAGTEIIAQGDQIAVQTPASRSPSTRFVVDKEDATTLVLHTDREGAAETFVFGDRGNMMVWKVDAQRSITFVKLR